MRAGQLVRNIKGRGRLGVIKNIVGDQAEVLFSKSGADETLTVNVDQLKNLHFTEKFYNKIVELN